MQAVADPPFDGYGQAPNPQPPNLQPPSNDDAHFVIKRGHLGRYRFTLILKDKRLSGEVRINTLGALRSDEDKAALAEVKCLAEALVASLAAQTPAPE